MIVFEVTRPVAKSWRVMREVKTYAGIQLRDIPFLGGDSMRLWAETPERAIENARALGVTGELVALGVES